MSLAMMPNLGVEAWEACSLTPATISVHLITIKRRRNRGMMTRLKVIINMNMENGGPTGFFPRSRWNEVITTERVVAPLQEANVPPDLIQTLAKYIMSEGKSTFAGLVMMEKS
jgi:hypothetical protein